MTARKWDAERIAAERERMDAGPHEHHGPNGRVVRHDHYHGRYSHYHGHDAPPQWRWKEAPAD